MNQDMLLEHLKAAERHVAQSREHIAHQREIIAQLQRDGHQLAAEKAAVLLQLLLDTQALHEIDRDRIQRALDQSQPAPVQPAATDGLTAEHCYARADECRARADRTSSNEARQLWLLAAKSWSFLAARFRK
jgi:hypothetical protein